MGMRGQVPVALCTLLVALVGGSWVELVCDCVECGVLLTFLRVAGPLSSSPCALYTHVPGTVHPLMSNRRIQLCTRICAVLTDTFPGATAVQACNLLPQNTRLRAPLGAQPAAAHMRQPLPCLFVVQGIMPGGKKTKEMKILTGVTGVLKPVRLPALPALPDLPAALQQQLHANPHALTVPKPRERS